MDNEALLDQIVRRLSFEVVAVPQSVVQTDSTSKSTPLNVKIRVKKKHDAGLRHGVLSMPKVDTKMNTGKDNVPERIRLVSSDQTIMSFNVLMETDLDKMPQKQRKENMNLVSPGLGIGNKDQYSIDSDFTVASPIISKRNKDIFGKCKPGGCLDPPYGEEKYFYQPKQQNQLLPIKDDCTKLRSSSIFKNKIFKRKKKNSQDDAVNKNEMKRTTEEDSIVCSNEIGSLQTSTVYSNSIITYPHPSNSGELFLQEDKNNRKSYSSYDRKSSRCSVIEDAGSYFILPKKKKKQASYSTMNTKLQSNDTRDNDSNSEQVKIDLNKPEFNNIPQTLSECSLNDELKNKQFNDPNFIPNPLLHSSNDGELNNIKETIDNLKGSFIDEKNNINLLLHNILPIKTEDGAETNTYSKTQSLACNRYNLSQQNVSDTFESENCLPLPEIKTLNYVNDAIDFSGTLEKSENSLVQKNNPGIRKYDASHNKQKEILPDDKKRLAIDSLIEKQKNMYDPIVLQKLRIDTSNAELNLTESYINNQNVMFQSNTDYNKDNENLSNDNLRDKIYIKKYSIVSSKEKFNLNRNTNPHWKEKNNSSENVSGLFMVCDNTQDFPYETAQDDQTNIVTEHVQSLVINDLKKIEGNVSDPTILQKSQNDVNVDTDMNDTSSLINKIIPITYKCNVSNKNNDLVVNNEDLRDIISHTHERLNLDVNIKHSRQVEDSLNLNTSEDPMLSGREKKCETTSSFTSQDRQLNTFSKNGIKLNESCAEILENVSKSNVLQDILNFENCDTDISQTRLLRTNYNFLTETKSNISNTVKDQNISNNQDKDQMNIKSNILMPKEQSILDNISDISRPTNEDEMQNFNNVLKLFNNKEHNKSSPNTKTGDIQQIHYSKDGKTLTIDSHKEINRETSEIVVCQDTQSSKNYETDQNLINDLNCSINFITDGQNSSSVCGEHQMDIRNSALVIAKETSVSNTTHDLASISARNINKILKLSENEENISIIPYSTDDLHHIWENNASQLKSSPDFVTITTLPSNRLTSEHVDDNLELLSLADTIQKQRNTNEHVTEMKTKFVSQTDLNYNDNKKQRITQDLLTNVNNEISLKKGQSKTSKSKGLFSQIDQTVNFSNKSTEIVDDIQLFGLKEGAESPNKLSIETSEIKHANFKRKDVFDEQIVLSQSRIDQQSVTSIQKRSFDHSDINYISLDSKDLKSTSPTSSKYEITSKDLIQNETKNSTKTIHKHNVSKFRKYTEILNDESNVIERNELTFKHSPYLVSDKVKSKLIEQFTDINATKNASVKLDQLSSNEIPKDLIETQHSTKLLSKELIPWKIDIALQSYIDENNDKIIKSFDSRNTPKKSVSDAILVAQCYLGMESNEIKIPINQETELSIQIKSSRHPNQSILNLNENANNIVQMPLKKKFEFVRPHQTDLDISVNPTDYEDLNKPQANKCNKVITDDLRDALNTIYELELLPLQDIIKGLREEIDTLVAHQNRFKEKVQKLASKRSKPDKSVCYSSIGIYNLKYCLALSLFLIAAIVEPVGYSFVLPAAICDLDMSDSVRGFIASIPYIGIVLTSFPWGYLVDTRGRKRVVILSSLAAGVLSMLSALMPNLITFTICKFLTSLCIACPAAVPYTFIGEILPQRYRDVTLSITNALQITGSALVPLIAWGILPLDFRINFGSYYFRSWRLLVIIYGSIFIIAAVLLSFGPESPKYLISQRKHDEALKVLQTIYAGNKKKSPKEYPRRRI